MSSSPSAQSYVLLTNSTFGGEGISQWSGKGEPGIPHKRSVFKPRVCYSSLPSCENSKILGTSYGKLPFKSQMMIMGPLWQLLCGLESEPVPAEAAERPKCRWNGRRWNVLSLRHGSLEWTLQIFTIYLCCYIYITFFVLVGCSLNKSIYANINYIVIIHMIYLK